MGIPVIAPRGPEADAETLTFRAHLLGALEQAVIATDLAGIIRYWNPPAERLYGWTAEEALGRSMLALISGAPFRQQVTEIMGRLQAGEHWTGEFLVRRRDGSTFPVCVVDTPIYDAAGTLIGLVGVSFDNSLAKHAEDALAQMVAARDQALDEARTALRVRNEFLASVAHDLTSPLTVIQGFAKLALRQVLRARSTPERLIDQLTHISETAAQMTDQIQELLDVVHLQSGEALPLHRSPTDLVALVQTVVAQYRTMAPAHDITFVPPSSELVGDWDALRLRRVLDNVVNNAVKYSNSDDAVTLVVDRIKEQGHLWAVLTIHDDGVGIPAADLPHLFHEFQRGANVQGLSGTGLGLAGAKHIVEQHGGMISIQSQEGTGTTVTIRLPLAP